VVKHISLSDCPGHHSYVNNMIKGSSVVDCAVVVTDVRKKSLGVQTLEHLAILEILGVRSVIIVQNKIDLVGRSECVDHYRMLRRELRGTIGEGSRVYSMSAVSGIGLDIFLVGFLEMLGGVGKKSGKSLFSVIRSFDINRKGCGVDELKGGVLGGTFMGKTEISVGDKLLIKPGGYETSVVSIFCEKERMDSVCASGGLWGIGTKLDPSLCKADGLAGSVVCIISDCGGEGSVKVVQEVWLKYVMLRKGFGGEDRGKLRKGVVYTVMLGNMVEKCICLSVNRGERKVCMRFLKPVCLGVFTNCLIYTCESSRTRMIGFGKVVGEEVGEEGGEDKKSEALDEQELEREYMGLLEKIKDGEKEKREKVKIPVPVIERENRNSVWVNITSFCCVVHRPVEGVKRYLEEELMMTTSVCEAGLRVYKRRITARSFEKVLGRYIKRKVKCLECGGVNTREGSGKYGKIVCSECGGA